MTVRIGLVGTQFIGSLYAYSLREIRGAEIVAVAAPNTAEAFAARHAIPAWYRDYRSMIEATDLDAVAIAVPNDLHYDVCLAAADRGKHILCEKPLALSLEEADTMIAACRRAGVVLMYGENLLFAPMYRHLRDLARQGEVGPPFLAKHAQCHGGPYSPWFWDVERAGGGVLLDMGCHSIHTLCWVLGAWPEAVTASLGRFVHADRTLGEDHSSLVLHLPGGRMAIAENSWAMPGGEDRLEVYGPGGRLVADLERGPTVRSYRAPATETAADASASRGGWRYSPFREAWQFGFPQELQHFVDVIQGQAVLESGGEDGRRVLEIICAAYESARTGTRVQLPFASDREKPVDHWLNP